MVSVFVELVSFYLILELKDTSSFPVKEKSDKKIHFILKYSLHFV